MPAVLISSKTMNQILSPRRADFQRAKPFHGSDHATIANNIFKFIPSIFILN
jgi:hypothetical protein